MSTIQPTERTRAVRSPKRATYDREQIHAILDEAMICHIGFTDPAGRPVVIPTAYGRKDNILYIHGSAASRMMRTLEGGVPMCLTVTLLDGLVLSRSAFHHSVNYRSVVVFGEATLITDEAEKLEGLRIFTEHIVPDRWDAVRAPTAQEMKATTVLKLSLDEASAKARTGPPNEDEADRALHAWGGVIPCHMQFASPIDDGRLLPGVQVPSHVSEYRRPGLTNPGGVPE